MLEYYLKGVGEGQEFHNLMLPKPKEHKKINFELRSPRKSNLNFDRKKIIQTENSGEMANLKSNNFSLSTRYTLDKSSKHSSKQNEVISIIGNEGEKDGISFSPKRMAMTERSSEKVRLLE